MKSSIVFACSVATALNSGCAERANTPSAPAIDMAASVVGRNAFAWSDPVWLGPVVNSAAADWRPVLATDGLSLYFHSNRAGGLGGFDIWVSRRASPGDPWEPPVPLGAPVNTASGDGDPAFTPDGRVMFYSSEGHGGAGRGDIFITWRADPADDLAWETPVNLGPDVNTAAHESNPAYVASEAGGTLYFVRPVGGAAPPNSDIFSVRVSRDGRIHGAALKVAELSEAPPIGDNAMTVRADGRELIFWSGGAAGTRPGTVGLADLWVSTRCSVHDPWGAPRNLGRPVNFEFADLSATLSHDGRMLFLTASQQRGGLGQNDLWVSTRNPGSAGGGGDSPPCGQ